MAPEASHTILPGTPPKRGAFAFAILFAVESFARAIVSATISVQAYDLLHQAQRVSVLFTSVSIVVLITSLCLPMAYRHLPRRWTYTMGACLLIAGAIGFAAFTLPGQVAGMFFRNVGSATMSITLSLYIMDHIRKADLVRSEPIRLSLSTLSWTIGPFLGVWLYENIGQWAPQVVCIIGSLVLILLFWRLRLSDHPVIRATRSMPQSPVRNVGRFIAQPRLRLAWTIAFARSCFWSSFFVYGPLMMIEGKLGKEAGGILVSIGNLVLCTAYLSGKLSERVGLRRVISGALLVGAVASICAGLSGTSMPYVTAGLLLVGATCASMLDGIAGIPFLRSVKSYERTQMASVYRTFVDFSDLLPSLIFSFALLVLPLGAVFVILGVWLAIVGVIAWAFLPRSM
ncbi:MFS transporter [soil metagenome]